MPDRGKQKHRGVVDLENRSEFPKKIVLLKIRQQQAQVSLDLQGRRRLKTFCSRTLRTSPFSRGPTTDGLTAADFLSEHHLLFTPSTPTPSLSVPVVRQRCPPEVTNRKSTAPTHVVAHNTSSSVNIPVYVLACIQESVACTTIFHNKR